MPLVGLYADTHARFLCENKTKALPQETYVRMRVWTDGRTDICTHICIFLRKPPPATCLSSCGAHHSSLPHQFIRMCLCFLFFFLFYNNCTPNLIYLYYLLSLFYDVFYHLPSVITKYG